jgi:N-acetylglucosaminyldiphosphoundecaprenol N-acetyl-beta-D-mannosaminyltransferase
MNTKFARIITLDINIQSYNSFLDSITALGKAKLSSMVAVANVHMCIEAYRDLDYARLINSSNLITPDGMPLVKAIKLLYGLKQDRVAGMDLLPDLLTRAEKENLGVFFWRN